MEKQWKLIPTDQKTVKELQSALGIQEVFCQLLVQRGINNYEDAKRFFRPSLEDLHDPWLMKDMDKAIDRLDKAIKNNEKILLYGDYDVDGTTSVSMLYSFLEKHHSQLDYYIPDRYKEGYGVSEAGIDYAHQNGIRLIIAMDCGIKAHKQVASAKERDIDFIICDHHLPEPTLPDAVAILDPKRSDCPYPCKDLSGCGVSFKLVQAYANRHDIPFEEIQTLLDLLAVSIACDIVPMKGENRILTFFGLQVLNQAKRVGLKALIEKSGRVNALTIGDIVFGIGPMINAAGRLADAKEAVRLLLTKNEDVANSNAQLLYDQNIERRKVDQRIATEAIEKFENTPQWESKKSIVLYDENWHKGIVGIAAARLVENFYRPAVLLTESGGVAVGSARSVPGFDIHTALKSCEDLFTNFGGHMHAAGLTIPIENIPAFQKRFEEVVSNSIDKKHLQPVLNVATELKLNEINSSFGNILKQFAPFGPKNRNPVFITREVMNTGYSKIVKEAHLRLAIKQQNSKAFYGIAFGMAAAFERVEEEVFDVCYNLQENTWKGKTSWQLNVKDIKF